MTCGEGNRVLTRNALVCLGLVVVTDWAVETSLRDRKDVMVCGDDPRTQEMTNLSQLGFERRP